MSDAKKEKISIQEGELVQITFRVKNKDVCEELINSWLNDGKDQECGFETCSLATGADVFTYEQRSEAIKKLKELQKILANDSGNELSAMLGMLGGLTSMPQSSDCVTFDSMPFAEENKEEVCDNE